MGLLRELLGQCSLVRATGSNDNETYVWFGGGIVHQGNIITRLGFNFVGLFEIGRILSFHTKTRGSLFTIDLVIAEGQNTYEQSSIHITKFMQAVQ
jgi:hypothetical protein